jgi:3-deoxy-alpha-D-manno-octulosonate 8-oxidase
MAEVALGMGPLWENALGKNWERQIDMERVKEIYRKI